MKIMRSSTEGFKVMVLYVQSILVNERSQTARAVAASFRYVCLVLQYTHCLAIAYDVTCIFERFFFFGHGVHRKAFIERNARLSPMLKENDHFVNEKRKRIGQPELYYKHLLTPDLACRSAACVQLDNRKRKER